MRFQYLIVLIFLAIGQQAYSATSANNGHKRDTLISQADVERVIKTLAADDMQGRGSFTPGIEKAARFIEHEFKKIGLKNLKGYKSYRQNFTASKLTATTTVSINGKNVGADSIIAMSSAPAFNWTTNDVAVVKLTADMDFSKTYRAYVANGKKQLVLVAPSFTSIFKRTAALYRKSRYIIKHTDSAATVFVLGNFAPVQSFAVSYNGQQQQMPLFNIAGIIPGRSKKKEFVIFGAHYDHLGIVKPAEGDSIANGADDDASGTTAIIELARYFKKRKNNQRTLIFVAFTAEEIGGFGSQYFATQVDPDKTVAMFNIEMIGKPSKFGQNSAFITGFDRSDFATILQSNLQNTPFKFYPDPYPQQNLFLRSDNASLAKLGVPAHSISTDQIDTDTLYHSVKDEISTLNIANITATIKAIALSSRTIISGADTPKRLEKTP